MPGKSDAYHETAAQYMVTHVPTARPWETVAPVLERLRDLPYDATEAVCVVDDQRHLIGLIPLARLLTAPPDQRLEPLTEQQGPSVAPEEDQEIVASLAMARGVMTVPVVDNANRLLGIVPSGALLQILRHEHIEDMNRLVGILKNGDQARNAIEGSRFERVFHRLPWLLIGLLGSMAATWLMAVFEQALAARLEVAFFIPAVVYLADAIGTQTEAVAVRGLTFSHSSLSQLLAGELLTGLWIGLILAALIFPSVAFVFSDSNLAAAVAFAVVTAGLSASAIGLLLPWLLSRLSLDPAFGSGPVATILQDLLSLMAYLVTVSWLVT
jgi:magnesium transporter